MGIRGSLFSIRYYVGPLCVWIMYSICKTWGISFQWQECIFFWRLISFQPVDFINVVPVRCRRRKLQWMISFLFNFLLQQPTRSCRDQSSVLFLEMMKTVVMLKGLHLFLGLMQLLFIRGLKAQFRPGPNTFFPV